MGVRDWDIVTSYVDSVTTTLKTVTFPKTQEQVKVKNQGNANLTYTIGTQSGTLTPGQSVTVNESISSFTIQSASGTQPFELRAKEKGTEIEEIDSIAPSDVSGNFKWIPFDNGYVTFSFDDGYDSPYDAYNSILKPNNMPMCMAPMNASRQISLAKLKDLQDNGCEIQVHGLNHLTILPTSTYEQDYQELVVWKKKLVAMGFNIYGHVRLGGSDYSTKMDFVREHFDYAVTDYTGSNFVDTTYDQYRLNRVDMANTTLAGIQSLLDTCASQKKWLILYAHRVDGTDGDLTTTKLQSIVDYIKTKGIKVDTCNNILRKFGTVATKEKMNILEKNKVLQYGENLITNPMFFGASTTPYHWNFSGSSYLGTTGSIVYKSNVQGGFKVNLNAPTDISGYAYLGQKIPMNSFLQDESNGIFSLSFKKDSPNVWMEVILTQMNGATVVKELLRKTYTVQGTIEELVSINTATSTHIQIDIKLYNKELSVNHNITLFNPTFKVLNHPSSINKNTFPLVTLGGISGYDFTTTNTKEKVPIATNFYNTHTNMDTTGYETTLLESGFYRFESMLMVKGTYTGNLRVYIMGDNTRTIGTTEIELTLNNEQKVVTIPMYADAYLGEKISFQLWKPTTGTISIGANSKFLIQKL